MSWKFSHAHQCKRLFPIDWIPEAVAPAVILLIITNQSDEVNNTSLSILCRKRFITHTYCTSASEHHGR